MITVSARKARLKAEYEAMCALPYTGLFSWKLAPGQKAPYVTQYLITYNNKTLVKGPGGIVKTQMSTTVQISINPDVFPTNAPIARVVSGAVPFHPNWWENGNVCNGNIWNVDMWIWQYAIKIGRVLAFDPSVTNIGSPANRDAIPYWNAHLRSFPCGRINFPHPKGY